MTQPGIKRGKASGRISVDVLVEAQNWTQLQGVEDLCKRAVEAAHAYSALDFMDGAELSILLSDDSQIRALNLQWRKIDKATNVLSFPAVPAEKLSSSPVLGDMALAFETVLREAEADGKQLADHVLHLIVHGFLHILGYDHETQEEAERMEALEIDILAKLQVPNPYANTDLLSAVEKSIGRHA